MRVTTGGDFRDRYGPWAVVAGASAGLGAAFARQLAARGLHLVLIARRADLLGPFGEQLTAEYKVQVRPLPLDLAQPDAATSIAEHARDLEVGLLIYNAALSVIGPFLERPLEAHLGELNTNCYTPLRLAYTFGQLMRARRRGGVVLMSSLSASQGSALLANYAATKAYNLLLAEGLWDELRAQGVDVLACCAGATQTPNYVASAPEQSRAVPLMKPEAVVAETLAALGKRPSVIPGRTNRLAAFVMRRLLPRALAVQLMGRATRALYAR